MLFSRPCLASVCPSISFWLVCVDTTFISHRTHVRIPARRRTWRDGFLISNSRHELVRSDSTGSGELAGSQRSMSSSGRSRLKDSNEKEIVTT